MDELLLSFLMGRMAEVDEEEFFDTAPMFLMELGFNPTEICRMMFDLGEMVGHVSGHLCAETEQMSQAEVGVGGYL